MNRMTTHREHVIVAFTCDAAGKPAFGAGKAGWTSTWAPAAQPDQKRPVFALPNDPVFDSAGDAIQGARDEIDAHLAG